MLPLSTQAKTEGINEPLVLKVVTIEEVSRRGWPLETSALWLPEDFQDGIIASVFNLPWGACIARAGRGRPAGWQGPWIHSLCDSYLDFCSTLNRGRAKPYNVGSQDLLRGEGRPPPCTRPGSPRSSSFAALGSRYRGASVAEGGK
jgi:hypothetical protein